MNLYKIISTKLSEILSSQGYSTENVTIEPPKDASFGDMATNAAMVLAKKSGTNPREFAENLAKEIALIDEIEDVSIAGAGFINMRLKKSIWQQLVPQIISLSNHYGDSDIGDNHKVNVEYVSANPTGPLHIGHGRNAVYGDALSSLLEKAGYDVTKEYYVNDAGKQVEILAESVRYRYRGEQVPDGYYPAEYVLDIAKDFQGNIDNLDEVKAFAIAKIMEMIKADLHLAGVNHDIFASEAALQPHLPSLISRLTEMGLIYNGILEPPKGKIPDDWEPREQTLFKSTIYGDDVDRPILKSDNSFTYFASDIAYTEDKIRRGFERLIMVLGADHGGYVKRMQAVTSALSDNKVKLEVKLMQLVQLFKDGEPFKMSKRAGNFVTVQDVVEEVGKDIFRFMMLSKKNDMGMEFDLDKTKEQSKDNPVFYVQYAHARAKSVIRNSDITIDAVDYSLLSSDDELALIKLMGQFPRIIEAAAIAAEPHRIVFYLQDLAAHFHSLWNVTRFILPDNPPLTKARIAMVMALTTTISTGLEIIGVKALEEM